MVRCLWKRENKEKMVSNGYEKKEKKKVKEGSFKHCQGKRNDKDQRKPDLYLDQKKEKEEKDRMMKKRRKDERET